MIADIQAATICSFPHPLHRFRHLCHLSGCSSLVTSHQVHHSPTSPTPEQHTLPPTTISYLFPKEFDFTTASRVFQGVFRSKDGVFRFSQDHGHGHGSKGYGRRITNGVLNIYFLSVELIRVTTNVNFAIK